MNRLHEKISSRTARIGVIGQGYVGLPLAVDSRNLVAPLFAGRAAPCRVVKA
jgi:hypothetical protein